MKYLFIASDKAESAAFPSSCEFVYTGVGLSIASAVLAKALMNKSYDAVINIGSAGAIKRDIGDVVRVKSIYNLDLDLTAFHLPPCTTLLSDKTMLGELTISNNGVILGSSSRFSSQVIPLHETLSIDICDMEAYSEAVLCKTLKIPFYSFKVVTDKVGVRTKLKDYKTALKTYRENLASFVLNSIEL